MFTPPPSPNPPPVSTFASIQDSPTKLSPTSLAPPKYPLHPTLPASAPLHPSKEDDKRRTGRLFRHAVIFVPIIVIAITAAAQYLAHGPPSFITSFDLPRTLSNAFSSTPCHGKSPSPDGSRLLAKREPSPQLVGATGSSTPGAASTTIPSTANQPIPTVPAAPPILPTPFPQPFDGLITNNFSSVSCMNFIKEMTSARAFRACRPLSLLHQNSGDFVSAQTNLTLLNNMVWGTCNTVTPELECVSNMASYASNLQVQCQADLKDRNAIAVSTLRGLEAYSVMREAACLTDPTTNTYCFVNAARDRNPTNFYYYTVPLGIRVPSSADPSCTACLKSLMGTYADALKDSVASKSLTGLQMTYERAAELTLGKCGAGSAEQGLSSAAFSNFVPHMWAVLMTSGLVGIWTLLQPHLFL